MRLIPKHSVVYAHVLHTAGEAFEIDPKDAEEMKQYGDLIEEPEATEPPKRGGRPKKNV